MQPTKSLPENYQLAFNLNLAKNPKTALWLQIVVLVLAYVFWNLFNAAIANLRGAEGVQFSWSAGELPLLLLSFFLMVLMHEAVHGLFFWVYTQERPQFGFKLAYAYAAAPDWYLPRNQFIVVGLAPLVLLSILGLLTAPLYPASIIKGVVFFLTLNAAGAVGDMYTIIVTLRYSPDALVNDQGEEFSIFTA